MKLKWQNALPAILAFILCTALTEALSRGGMIPSSLIPAPSQVLKTLLELHGDFQAACLETLRNTVAGFFLSVIFGGMVAFIFSSFDFIRRAILPFAVFFQTVPIIAIAPLLVIYFGFGAPTVIASSFIVSVFPVLASTLAGLESTTSSQRDLLRLYGANRWQSLLKLKLPNAYSHILAGLKIAAGLSLIGTIAGEFVAGGGLGAMIDVARTQQRVDIVFGALLILSFLGFALITGIQILHLILNHRRPFFQGES